MRTTATGPGVVLPPLARGQDARPTQNLIFKQGVGRTEAPSRS